jgi:sulfur carrier protein ThiS
MNLIVNGRDLTVDTKSNAFTVADLLKHLEIDFWVDVEKNGVEADKTEEVAEGDWINIIRFIRGG